MSRSLQKYLDGVMIYANRNEKDAARIRAELEDHLLKKIADLQTEGLSREDAVFGAIEELGSPQTVGCGLRKRFRWFSVYIPVAIILFVVDWLLLLGRFYWFGFGAVSTWIYTVINFPCSILYLLLEKKPNTWWYGVFGRRFEYLFNDETGILLAFIILVLLQAILITLLFLRLRTRWKSRDLLQRWQTAGS
ncbi:MAG: permease prefix domain 1-containing protein [Planctomycetota bacterium]|jgi:hypothetical protein